MKKLTLNTLALYGKGLHLKVDGIEGVSYLEGVNFNSGKVICYSPSVDDWDEEGNSKGLKSYSIDKVTPYLRPLSMIKREITIEGETFVPIIKMGEIFQEFKYDLGGWYNYIMSAENHFKTYCYGQIPHDIVMKLYEWHFDIQLLLPKQYALDFYTLIKGDDK